MRSTFFGLEMAWRTVEIAKAQLDTISHNLANASREDYSRQEVTVEASPAYTVPARFGSESPGQMGTGAQIASIERQTNAYLEFLVSQNQMRYEEASVRDELLGHIERITTDAELSTQLDVYFAAWQEVANHPESTGVREALLAMARGTIGGFQQALADLASLETDINEQIKSAVTRVNGLAEQLAEVNRNIALVKGSGQNPNDLMDERDQLVRQLVQLTGASYREQDNGSVLVAVKGHVLVQQFDSYAIEATGSPPTSLAWASDGALLEPTSGELSVLFEQREVLETQGRVPLAQLLDDVVRRTNALHSTGYGLDGITGRDFISGTNAYEYEVAVTASQVAAGADSASGNGQIALDISLLAEEAGPLGQRYSAYLNSYLTGLGALKQNAESSLESRSSALKEAKAKRASSAGVSTDEEVMAMLQAQHTLEAAARVMDAADEILGLIVNNMGVVGR